MSEFCERVQGVIDGNVRRINHDCDSIDDVNDQLLSSEATLMRLRMEAGGTPSGANEWYFSELNEAAEVIRNSARERIAELERELEDGDER